MRIIVRGYLIRKYGYSCLLDMDNHLKDLAVQFGNKLKAKRKSLNISQDKLALLSDIDRSYVGRIERGEVRVTLEKAYCLADAMGCDVREILP